MENVFENFIKQAIINAKRIIANPFIEISLLSQQNKDEDNEIIKEIDHNHYRVSVVYQSKVLKHEKDFCLKGFKIPSYYFYHIGQDSREILLSLRNHEIMSFFKRMNLDKLFKINSKIYIE